MQLRDTELWVKRDAKGDLDVLNLFAKKERTSSKQPWQVSVRDSVVHFTDLSVLGGAKNDINIATGNFVGMGDNVEGGAEVDIPGLVKGELGYKKDGTKPILFGKNLSGKIKPILHRQRQAEFQCGQGAMLDYYGEASRQMEKEANVFASYLLMPATDFRQQIDGQTVTLELLGEVADRYQTSFTATALKWLEITEEAAMLVVARDEFVCWSYPSKLARSRRAWLAPGTPVSESALDRLKSAANRAGNTWCRVPAGVWHPSMEAEECVIVSDQFELTIFLLRYPEARVVMHEEETETDAFDVMTDASRGFDWSR